MKTKNIIGLLLLTFTSMFCVGQNVALKSQKNIAELTRSLTKNAKNDEQKVEALYLFVRDSIQFGWVYPLDIPVSEILRNRKGVCMQKANVLVALLRECSFEARFRFMYVEKKALEDFLPDFAYKKWLDPFLHTVVEIKLNGKWISVEPTFDKELHELCFEQNINFAKYSYANEVSIEFNPQGIKACQQYVAAKDSVFSYGEDLSPLMEYTKNSVPWIKRIFKPMVFRKADKKMIELRTKKQ